MYLKLIMNHWQCLCHHCYLHLCGRNFRQVESVWTVFIRIDYRRILILPLYCKKIVKLKMFHQIVAMNQFSQTFIDRTWERVFCKNLLSSLMKYFPLLRLLQRNYQITEWLITYFPKVFCLSSLPGKKSCQTTDVTFKFEKLV